MKRRKKIVENTCFYIFYAFMQEKRRACGIYKNTFYPKNLRTALFKPKRGRKTMKKYLIALSVLTLLAFCACGVLGSAEETAAQYYVLSSINYGGQEMDPGALNITSMLTLNADGTGVLSMNGSEAELPKWTLEGGVLTLYAQNGGDMACGYENGVVTMEMGENYYWYYTLSDGPIQASLLSAVCAAIDGNAGAHLNYEFHSDYMDSVSAFDVHARGGAYYSHRVTKVSGRDQTTDTCFLNGVAYLLYPDEMRAKVATSTSSSAITQNTLIMDSLFKAMYQRAQRTDFTTETQEIEGVAYTAEIYPGSDYVTDMTFYFDQAGNLVHALEGAPKTASYLGETFYTVHAIDTDVNDALFDISAYTVEQ